MAKKTKTNTANPLDAVKETQEKALEQLAYWQTAEGQKEAKEYVAEMEEKGQSAWPKPRRGTVED